MQTDKSNVREVILDSVRQLDADLEFFNQLNISRRAFSKIILCGMGGSAQIGDFFYFLKTSNFTPLIPKLPIFIHRNYDLPADADENSLIVCISYSGNTEETLSSFAKAKQKGLEAAVIAGGGKLSKLCQDEKTPWIKIPQTLQPRLSLGYQFSALIKIFMAYGLLDSFAHNELKGLSERIIPSRLEEEAKSLCQNLNRKTPVIYTSDKNWPIARVWKIKFNENTKIPAFWNYFPELNHNEMVGWTNTFGPFHLLILQDPDDHPQIKKRMELTAKILNQRGITSSIIKIQSETPLEKLFWSLVYGDWLSYHLALFYGTDPAPVEMVEEFKKMLNA